MGAAGISDHPLVIVRAGAALPEDKPGRVRDWDAKGGTAQQKEGWKQQWRQAVVKAFGQEGVDPVDDWQRLTKVMQEQAETMFGRKSGPAQRPPATSEVISAWKAYIRSLALAKNGPGMPPRGGPSPFSCHAVGG